MQKKLRDIRLPLECHFDLTYRCNNNCRHCWLRISPADSERNRELSFEEIRRIVDEARTLGTRCWSISGGEPLLRPDFPEIFDYITAKALSYTLNTNGTLLTPKLAQLLKRRGTKMVALYGATQETYDHVTRNPGSFEQLMQGFRYLKEAGAGFMVQLIPMKDNWHEWEKMIELAKSLSAHYRIGAPWLYLSSCQNPELNAEIARQRLEPRNVVELDTPDCSSEEMHTHECGHSEGDGRLFASCIAGRRDFHVDPYGGMSFCSFLKDPSMRYDLTKGSVHEGWEVFIPSLADREFGSREYQEKCGSCDVRQECRWCAVYGWLEHGRFSAPVEYLCEVARENKRYRDEWKLSHLRYYQIAGITIQVESDLKITDQTFHEKFASFRVDGPGDDMVTIRHHFGIPDLTGQDLGKELYRRTPWAISRQKGPEGSYIYLGISPFADDPTLHCAATFSADHTRVRIYNGTVQEESWRKGDLYSLTLFSTDQILIARLLGDRQGCYLHSSGVVLDGAGILFVGHSGAGKSTTMNFLIDAAAHGEMLLKTLCEDRNIIRRMEDGWQVYGTWDHGEVPMVSSSSAPLRAIFFIEQASENTITPLTERKEIIRRVIACLIKPFVTADWWEKTLDLTERIADEMPCYLMRFDLSGDIAGEITQLIQSQSELNLHEQMTP